MDHSHADSPVQRLIERALWWAYERAPGDLDTLFQLGRRYATPLVRHRLELCRLTGATGASGRTVTVLTAGAAMTLDFLVKRVFAGAPTVERLGRVSLARLPDALERLGAPTDLTLACVPRALAGWFGQHYLRVPALVTFRQAVGGTLEPSWRPPPTMSAVTRAELSNWGMTGRSRAISTSSSDSTASSTGRSSAAGSGHWPCCASLPSCAAIFAMKAA